MAMFDEKPTPKTIQKGKPKIVPNLKGVKKPKKGPLKRKTVSGSAPQIPAQKS